MKNNGRTKALSLLLCLAMLLSLVPGMSLTAYADTSGNTGANTWHLDGNTLTISGSGAMADYSNLTDRPWNNYCGNIQTVIIEEGVTSIGNYAFNGFTSLTSVTIPNSVTSIGKYAFVVTNLTSVNIPGNVTSIGTYAFGSCSNLESVTFTPGTADTNLVIGMGAFFNSKTGATVGYGTGSTKLYDNLSNEIKAGDALTKIYKSYSFDGDNKTFTWKSAHTHAFTYAASGATITATCTEDCPKSYDTTPATLTIAAPTDLAIDGTAKSATVTGTIPGVDTPSIVYTKGGKTVDAANVKELGTYTASIMLTGVKTGENATGNVTASVEFTITNPDYTISLPTGLEYGTVTANKNSAKFGEKVMLTVTPSDDNHILKTLTVKDNKSNNVTVTDKKFTMPAANVTVYATFGEKTIAGVKLICGEHGGTAWLLKSTYKPLTSSDKVREGDTFILCVSPDDEYDYKIGFDPSREVSSYVEEFSRDDYAKYVAYAQKNNISLSFQTDMYWVTMPGVDGDKLDVNVTFEKVKPFTILYRPTGNVDAVWCKFTKQTAGTENPFALEMKKDAVMGDQVVWSAKVMAAFAPKEIAFAATSDSLENAPMTDGFTAKQSIQNESDWTDIWNNGGKFVVISGDVKTIVAAFVTDPSSMAVYDSETVTFDAPNSSTGIVHVITVCATDADGNVNSAGTLTALAAPTGDAVPSGKEFAGWRGLYFENLNSKASDKIYAAGDEIRVRENTTFHAVWNPVTLTVALDLNGGTGVGNTVSVEYGQALTLSENPTKNGYDFGGWTVNKAVTENGVYFGRGSAFDTSTPITADLELTARWKHIHSYTYYKISYFGDLLEDYLSYESILHIKICDCDDLAFEAHSFDSSGKCSCGYRKLPETVTLKISYGKWDGMTYTPRMAEADRKVVKGQEVSVYAPGNLGPDMKFSKWQYSTDGSTWKDLASYTMVGFVIRADMQLRALYTNTVTKPQISMSATTYPVMVEGFELNSILLQMDYQLPDGYYYVDSGVKASDNIGIAYYEMKEIKKTAGQKAALAGVKLGLSFLPGAGLGDFLVDQTMEAMNGPEYYYEKRENSVLDIMTAKTLSDHIYKGIPVNMEKYEPLYWDYRPDTKGQSGSLNALIPLNFVQKNNWNHYIYGIAWLRYKDKAGNIKTIYTPALATTLDGVGSSTPVKQTGN
ncbi:MAG: leucine-rich repeat protein [Clostridia bacterium]|nr:leucine-rich repeat protein [Clostridia bacterium]